VRLLEPGPEEKRGVELGSGPGKVEFRVDKTGIIHAPVGKAGFPTDKLHENALTLIQAVVKAKPAAAKGKYVKSVTICSTMGPGVKLDVTPYNAKAL